MIEALLKIRLKQLYRGLIGIGFIRMLFLVGLMVFVGLFLFEKTKEETISQVISGGFLLLVTMIQIKRSDKKFLKSHFANYKLLLLSEYSILALPLIIMLIVHSQWYSLSYFLGLIIIIYFDLKTKYNSLNTKLQELIPSDSYEWKAGVRKHLIIMVSVWIISAVTSFFIASVPIAIFALGILICSFYEKAESHQMILSYELSAEKFLMLKIKRQLQLFSIIVTPLIMLYVIFNFQKWYIPLVEYIIFCFIHIYLITIKYTFFKPSEKSAAAQTIGSIGVIGGVIPVFLPVVWIFTIWYYKKSLTNLKFYLNDYN